MTTFLVISITCIGTVSYLFLKYFIKKRKEIEMLKQFKGYDVSSIQDIENTNDNWDDNYLTYYINVDSLDDILWTGKIKLDSLKLKDGRTHEFILSQVGRDGTIYGRSLTTNRDRLIYHNQVELIAYKSNFYHSVSEFIANEGLKKDYQKYIVKFKYTNNDGEQSERYIELQKVYRKFGRIYFRGLDSKRGEQRTFNFERMNDIAIDGTQFVDLDSILKHIKVVDIFDEIESEISNK